MDDNKKGFRSGLYGAPEETDAFVPKTDETFHDPLFEEKPRQEESPAARIALASLILGVLACLTACLMKVGAALGVCSAVCGIIALRRGKEEENPKWKKQAVLGIVLGLIALLIVGIAALMTYIGLLGQEHMPGMMPNPDEW